MNEDQREKLQTILARLGAIGPRRWVMYTAGIILIGFLISTWNQYGIVYVALPSGLDSKSTLKYMNSDDSKQSLVNLGSLVFVPRGNSALTVTAGEYRSVASVTIPWYGVTSVNLPTATTGGIDKYDPDSPGCANYDSEDDKLVSYRCVSPTNFSTIDEKTGLHQTVKPLLPTSQPSPFLNGILGITGGTTSQILYQDYSGSIIYIKSPEGLSTNDLALSNIITNHNDVSNTTFIIVPLSGDIFIGDYRNNMVSYTKLARPKEWTSKMGSVCQVLRTSAYCYQGLSSVAPGGDNEPVNTADGILSKIDTSSPGKVTVERYTVDPNIAVDGIYIASDGSLALTDGGHLYNFNYSGGTITVRQLTGDIKSAVATSDGVYFVKDNSLYKLQNKVAVSLFHSDNISIDRLSADNGSLFLTARSPNIGTNLSMYKLTAAPNDNVRILLGIVAQPTGFNDNISSIDFVKQTVFIRVKVTIDKKATRPELAVNQTEYNNEKIYITQQLEKLGLDTNALNLIFSY